MFNRSHCSHVPTVPTFLYMLYIETYTICKVSK